MTDIIKPPEAPDYINFSAATLSPIIHAILEPVTLGLGDMNDVMHLLEKVVTAVLMVASESADSDDHVLEILAGAVRGKLVQARLALAETGGVA